MANAVSGLTGSKANRLKAVLTFRLLFFEPFSPMLIWLTPLSGFNVQSSKFVNACKKKRATHTDYPKFITILELNYLLFFKNSSDLFISLYITVSS